MKNVFVTCLSLALLVAPAAARPPVMDKERMIPQFESYAEQSRQAWGTPGMAVVLLADGKVIYAKAFGVKETGRPEPVDVNTLFQIGSASKSFTSSLVALQVDRGKLQWTDRVVDHYADFRMFDPWVTREFRIEDTMSQRSGQAPYATDVLSFIGASRAEIMHALREVRPVSSFRSRFAYVNNLWLVAAQVVENLTGKTWEQNLQSDIFQPLAMNQSNTGLEGLFKSPNHVTPHQGRKGALEALGQSWPFSHWVYTYGPAGGINSNVLDMAKYVQMHLGVTPLLKPESLTKLHSPHVLVGGTTALKPSSLFQVAMGSYCLGWIRQELQPAALIWHNGGTSGCKTVVGFCPEAGMGIVVLSNLGNTELPEALMFRYYDMYFGRPDYDYSSAFLAGRRARPAPPLTPKNPRPAAPLSEYAGQYKHPVYGIATVSVVGNKLQVQLGQRMRLNLSPWDGDNFVHPDPMDAQEGPGFAAFTRDPAGKLSALQLTLAEDVSEGRFVRQ